MKELDEAPKDVVWRYMSLAKYVSLLARRELHVARVDSFPDETEGLVTARAGLHAVHWIITEVGGGFFRDAANRASALAPDDVDGAVGLAEEITATWRQHTVEALRGLPGATEGAKAAPTSVGRPIPAQLQARFEALAAKFESQPNHLLDALQPSDEAKRAFFASCWNGLPTLSGLLWDKYARGTDGVAVRTTRAKLEQVLVDNAALLRAEGLDGMVRDVAYYAQDEALPYEVVAGKVSLAEIAAENCLAKLEFYKHESEVRVLLFKHQAGIPVASVRSRIWLAIDPNQLVEEVYLHPHESRSGMMASVVGAIHDKFGVHAPVMHASIRHGL